MRLVGDENLKLIDLSPTKTIFSASKTFIWGNVVCRNLYSPTKRIFYHLGARAQLRPKLLKQGERIRLHESSHEGAFEISFGHTSKRA